MRNLSEKEVEQVNGGWFYAFATGVVLGYAGIKRLIELTGA